FLFSPASGHPRLLPSFPTRRSSDLRREPLRRLPGRARLRLRLGVLRRRRGRAVPRAAPGGARGGTPPRGPPHGRRAGEEEGARGDRKSTRLNSSHVEISYAVFCLKK